MEHNILSRKSVVGTCVFFFVLASTPAFAADPILDLIPTPQSVDELTELSFTATATDGDLDPLTFSLAPGAPAGASITAGGDFTWTPTEAQGPDSVVITVEVSDGVPGNAVDDSQSVTINVAEVNIEPTLDPIGNKTVNEGEELSFTATSTDNDLPANTLTYSLAPGFPTGASISPTGAFSWTPTEAQGPGNHSITVRVTDGVPDSTVDASETISVQVDEVNIDPTLDPIGNKTINEGVELSFTATSTDNDLPANTLTYSLAPGFPTGASITPGGDFTWTPSEDQGPGNHSITVRVTDGVPDSTVDDSETISVQVDEVNTNTPVLAAIGNQTVDEGVQLSFTATATDGDLPDDTLTFSLDPGFPTGASITPGGAFTWAPTEAQGPGNYNITVRVTDSGANEDFETISVQVLTGWGFYVDTDRVTGAGQLQHYGTRDRCGLKRRLRDDLGTSRRG
jgi:hypothetical protein